MLTRTKQLGMTLIEVMISVTVGLFLLLGLTVFMSASLGSNVSITKTANLNQELRAIMTLMVRDIRRSGYWGSPSYVTGAISGIGFGSTFVNPFALDATTAGCILYAYDLNQDGVLDENEKFGFLLDNGAVLMRTGVGSSTWNCTLAASNAWGYLSDTISTNITGLAFVETDSASIFITGSSGPNIRTRQITISISGQLANDSSVRQTLTETVKLENDLFSPS